MKPRNFGCFRCRRRGHKLVGDVINSVPEVKSIELGGGGWGCGGIFVAGVQRVLGHDGCSGGGVVDAGYLVSEGIYCRGVSETKWACV